MYDALEVAKYVINKCIKLGRPISNLQLQKILYYAEAEYMKKREGEVLFNNTINAWQYGPVIPEVYYNYNIYSASEITDYQDGKDLDSLTKHIIDPVIEKKSKLNAWTLVEKTHSEDPWINSFGNYSGCEITKKQIKEFFCK